MNMNSIKFNWKYYYSSILFVVNQIKKRIKKILINFSTYLSKQHFPFGQILRLKIFLCFKLEKFQKNFYLNFIEENLLSKIIDTTVLAHTMAFRGK